MTSSRMFLKYCLLVVSVYVAGCSSCDNGVDPIDRVTTDGAVITHPACIEVGTATEFGLTLQSGQPTSYKWTFTGADIDVSREPNPTVTYAAEGTFTAMVEVSQNAADYDPVNAQVNVRQQCLAATITSPSHESTYDVGATVPFGGTINGGDEPYAIVWEAHKVSAPATTTAASGSEANTSFTFPSEGTWKVTLSVTDALGDTSSDWINVIVGSASAFTVDIETSGDPGAIATGQSTVFSSIATGAVGVINNSWDFGASGVGPYSGENANVTFPNAGIFTVTLTATDLSTLAVATAMLEITVVLAQTSFQSPVTSVKKIAPGFQTANKGATDGLGFMGSNGMAVFDPATRTFGDVHLGVMTFGGVTATPAGVEPAFIFWDYYGLFIASYNSGSETYDAPSEFPGGIRVNDLCMYDDDPAASGFLVATWSDVIRFTWNAGTSAFEESATYEEALFQGASLTSIVARDGNAFLGTGFGSPSQLLYHDGVEGTNATVIGALGDSSTDLTRLGDICVVRDRNDDTCSIITWVGNTVTIVGSFPTGSNPQSVDLMLLENDNVGCVVPNRYDNTVTVVEISPAGSVVSNNTVSVSVPATPTEAVWARDGTTDVLVYDAGGGEVFVVPTGL